MEETLLNHEYAHFMQGSLLKLYNHEYARKMVSSQDFMQDFLYWQPINNNVDAISVYTGYVQYIDENC